jgi:tRNA(fMet)-specific endonuclease VapC
METAIAQRETIGVTIITKIETLQGRMTALLKADTHERFLHAQQELLATEKRLEEMRVLLLDLAALRTFDELIRIRGLKKIGRADLLIASIARVHQTTLVTRNLKHFKLIPQLKLENWVD